MIYQFNSKKRMPKAKCLYHSFGRGREEPRWAYKWRTSESI